MEDLEDQVVEEAPLEHQTTILQMEDQEHLKEIMVAVAGQTEQAEAAVEKAALVQPLTILKEL
ncbi:MAG: hypothetical protein CMF74_18925 [Maricaulis sp.]|nr:hypothetical protein [Maricaulis sp.]